MAVVTIYIDFGAQENKICHCFHCFPIYLPWSDRTGCPDLRFLNVEFYFFFNLSFWDKVGPLYCFSEIFYKRLEFLKKIFFLMWTIFKVFIEFITILLLFYLFFFFDRKACGILVPWPKIEPIPPALEGGFLTTGPPGRSLEFLF